MRYNTQRKKLKFMDYGRSVEGLIQYAQTIEDREQRNQAAQSIVEIMSRVLPRSRENAGWKRRMWDHMMVLSNWQLDVDWPVWAGRRPEIKPEETMEMRPRQMEYKTKRLKYRHYGRIIEKMVDRAKSMPESPERDELASQLIGAMKNSFSNWNNSSIESDMVYDHLYEMSDGVLDYRHSRPNVRSVGELSESSSEKAEIKVDVNDSNE